MNSGSVVRDYHIISLLGLGGMGEVYLAEEAMLGRKVAIKRLNPLLTNDAQFSERFVNEARIQAKLQHHNIVGLYNFFEEQGVYYMVMEYAPGITLKELIAQTGPIPEQRTLNIFKQIVDALSHAHAKEIIHRDIKPSNVLIDADDKVKIMDFGIARLLSDKHLTQTGAKVGTLFYMSPEQVKAAKDIDHRTDIYSAGIVLYEMLTGTLPFKADTDSDFDVMMEIVNNKTPNPREVYPHISDKTVAAVDKATQKKRETRYQDCHELDEALFNTGDNRDSKPVRTGPQTIKPPQKSTTKSTTSPSQSNNNGSNHDPVEVTKKETGEVLTRVEGEDEQLLKYVGFDYSGHTPEYQLARSLLIVLSLGGLSIATYCSQSPLRGSGFLMLSAVLLLPAVFISAHALRYKYLAKSEYRKGNYMSYYKLKSVCDSSSDKAGRVFWMIVIIIVIASWVVISINPE